MVEVSLEKKTFPPAVMREGDSLQQSGIFPALIRLMQPEIRSTSFIYLLPLKVLLHLHL